MVTTAHREQGESGERASRQIGLIAFDAAQLLDIAGPLEVFAAAARHAAPSGAPGPLYAVDVLSSRGGPIRSSSGLDIETVALAGSDPSRFDTLLVAGGRGTADALADIELLAWLRRAAVPGCVRRIGSVCTGAFLLAHLGLLDGRRAVTHWAHCATLAERYPAARVEPDPIFIQDGPVWTSAGVTAGIDLALAMVERDHGRRLALDVARELVVFLQRPGGQAQFSVQLAAQMGDAAREPVAAVRCWIAANPAADLSVEVLAARAGMGARTFARAFTAASGCTPARFVERARLEAARRLLEEAELPVDLVATRCGFGSAEVMRRAFHRRLATSPAEYRTRFRRAPAPQPEEPLT